MIVPERYGGLGFSAAAHSEVIARIASRSLTAAVTVMVPNSLGPGELLLHYGTDAQKDHFLPRLARGDEIPCFALTGPEAGSDAAATQSEGIVCHGKWNGEEILGMRLTWTKRYITLAPVATLIGLAFRLRDPEHLLGEQEDLGITCALVPANLPGVEIGRRHDPLGIPFQNGPTLGRDVLDAPARARAGACSWNRSRSDVRSRSRLSRSAAPSSPPASSAPTRWCASSSTRRSGGSKGSRSRWRASPAAPI
jgi:acyl-CoA dehydrogenase